MTREITPKMVSFFDKKLEKNGLAQDAIDRGDSRTLFALAAESCVGVFESGGNNKGPIVSLMQDTVGGPDAVAWCMSFVQTCLAYAELKTNKKSPVFVSEHCLSVWDKTPKGQRVKASPLPGAIVIWQKGKSMSGHTGIVRGADEKTLFTVEGNTGSDSKTVEREGDGVYLKKRSRDGQGNMKVLGYLKPF
jgi:ribosomal protein L27